MRSVEANEASERLRSEMDAAVAEVQKYAGHHPGLSLAENVREMVKDIEHERAEVQALREALVTSDSLLSLVRHRHRNTPWPEDLQCDVDAAIAQSRAALALAQVRPKP